MNAIPNKYIKAHYRLYNVTDGKKDLIEQTTDGKPFDFISGLGIALEAFEKQLVPLQAGDEFNFTLNPEEAFGQYFDERVVDLDKNLFVVNGKFDSENVYEDAVIMLQNQDGERFNARVLEINDDKVKMDLNHPLAGLSLRFEGQIMENRDASNEELANYINSMQGGCHCQEGHCQGEGQEGKHCCGHHGKEHDEGHCCGHHGEGHEEGHCCGHHGENHEDGHCCGHHGNGHEEGHCRNKHKEN